MANVRLVPVIRPLAGDEKTTHIDVETWTQRAVEAMRGVTLQAGPGMSAEEDGGTLHIPLDVDVAKARASESQVGAERPAREGHVLRRSSSTRDSLRRREAVLKGKEGSRQRRRWENDRLVGNPYAEPPLPVDWEVGYSHPVHTVPYYLAPLWDARYAKQSAARKAKATADKKARAANDASGFVGSIPRDLKDKLKRARGSKCLLQDLETEVRKFLEHWYAQEPERDRDVFEPDSSDDEETVFVGRCGQMHDMPSAPRRDGSLELKKLVFDSLEEDQGASFGRWLVHSIGQYYGLETWSITAGDPARRGAYVGISEVRLRDDRRLSAIAALPRPLWALV